MTSKSKLIKVMREDHDGDNWAWVMSWIFFLCDEMQFHRNMDVPQEFGYRPSPFGSNHGDEEYKVGVITDLSPEDADILHASKVLHRYAHVIDLNGESY